MFTSHRKHIVYNNRKNEKYNTLKLSGLMSTLTTNKSINMFSNTSFNNKKNFVDDKFEEKKSSLANQKAKDDVLKQGIKEHEENLYSNKNNRSNSPTNIDGDSQSSDPIIVRSFDERVEHYKYLHFTERQELFNIQYTTIHKAAMDGDYLGVKHFLSRKTKALGHINVDDYDRVGLCPIHYATINGRLEIIELLIYCGCDVNIKSNDGLTPMMFACKHNQLESMKVLFRYGASIAVVSYNGMTCAHYAAINDHLDVIILLSEFLTQLKAAVIAAIETQRAEVDLNVLDSENAQQLSTAMYEIEGFNILTKSILNQLDNKLIDPETIQQLTDYDILNKPTITGITPLHIACEFDSLKTVKVLIEMKKIPVDTPDISSETPLHKAGRNKHYLTYKYLVSCQANEKYLNILKQTPKQLLYDDIQF